MCVDANASTRILLVELFLSLCNPISVLCYSTFEFNTWRVTVVHCQCLIYTQSDLKVKTFKLGYFFGLFFSTFCMLKVGFNNFGKFIVVIGFCHFKFTSYTSLFTFGTKNCSLKKKSLSCLLCLLQIIRRRDKAKT